MGNHKVTPERLKIIIALGCEKVGAASAERLEEVLNIPVEEVLLALDGLLETGVVEDIDAEEFHLSEYGSELFTAIYDATGAVLGGGS